MEKRSLLILILLTIPSTTALCSKQPEHQEAEQVTKTLGPFRITENWSDALKGARFQSIVYASLARKRKAEICNINRQKQDILTQLNQEQISHEQTRAQLTLEQKIIARATEELKKRADKISELNEVIETLTNINERLIKGQEEDFGL
ncbi:MAG: hypothetical protein P4L31_00665 [Candidatus Babeliales bacterium]|nr:hypothetical protein [Candidatus Babeliales bacterium]